MLKKTFNFWPQFFFLKNPSHVKKSQFFKNFSGHTYTHKKKTKRKKNEKSIFYHERDFCLKKATGSALFPNGLLQKKFAKTSIATSHVATYHNL